MTTAVRQAHDTLDELVAELAHADTLIAEQAERIEPSKLKSPTCEQHSPRERGRPRKRPPSPGENDHGGTWAGCVAPGLHGVKGSAAGLRFAPCPRSA